MARSSLLTASWRRNLLRWAGEVDDAFGTVSGHYHDGTDSKSITASVTYGTAGQMAAAGTGAANAAGTTAASARIDHVHALGAHDHSSATTGGAVVLAAIGAGMFTADATGRGKFADSFVNTAKIAAGTLSADASGRALMATGYFTAAHVLDAFAANSFDATACAAVFAASAIPQAKVNWTVGVTPTVIQPDASAAEGSSSSVARADHTHGIVGAAPSATNSFAAAVAEGTSTSFLRADAVFLARVANATYWLGRNAADGANINAWQISTNDLFRIGTVSWEVATANLVTFTVTNPAAARTVTFGDPGGADSVVYLAATQTLSGKSLTAPAITGGTAIELTTFSLRSSGGNDLVIASSAAYSADRTLTVNIPTGANAALTLVGDLITAGGAFALTLTMTAATNVTLPTTGTLATLAGTETLTGKTITMAGVLTMADQLLHGSSGAGGNLLLSSTSHATKGYVRLANGEIGVQVGGTAARATPGTNAINIFDGSAPAGALANGVSLYSSGGEFYGMDAVGNATLNSPHSEDGDYIIYSYSATKGKTVVLHLEKMLRQLAARFPADFAALLEETPGLVHKNERVTRGLNRI